MLTKMNDKVARFPDSGLVTRDCFFLGNNALTMLRTHIDVENIVRNLYGNVYIKRARARECYWKKKKDI